MIASRLLAVAFLAASLAPVAAMAQTTSDNQTPAATQAKPEHAKPEHAKPAHAKRDHAGAMETPAGEAAKTTPVGEAAKTAPATPAAPPSTPAK